MKIAHIAPPWIPIPPKTYGGTEAVIYNLVEEQVAQGHDVTLFAPGDAKTSAKHISFFPESLNEIGVPWAAHSRAFYHLYKSLEYAESFDIIHTHLSSSSDIYIFPLTASLTTPHVTTLHSRFPFERVETWIGGDGDKYYMEWAQKVPMIAISESAKAEVPYDLNFVGVVYHGLPLIKDLSPGSQERGNFVVWLGRIVPDKGTRLAVEAAKRAGVPIVLAGNVDHHQPDSVSYYNDEIEPLIDNETVKYIGPVNKEQKIELLSHARGLLNPIQWEEPFGMVMIEAMAYGCPVISFDRGAAPEIVVHGKTGFLVHDLNEMVNSIARLDEIDRSATHMYVEDNFSARAMAEKYIQIYHKVIKKGRTP